ncbi:MAG: biosynthetic-type acetolactate synthase large subunit [Lachnospiraceae bacterium]|nr:biosynthetic-type acetolactate synthase large subunit [Lachnospiraceae bacterium]
MSSTKISGAELTVRILIEQNIDLVFGYPGGQVLDLYDSLYKHRKEIKHVLTAHEQGAAHAADGYARATGKVGVCIATSGPGATNLVTGIAAAYMDSIPMVAITGNVPTSQIGTDSFQEVDITGITMPITKHNFFVDTIEELPGTLRKAFSLAVSGRPGPVLVDIPKDIQEAMCVYEPEAPVKKDEPFSAKDIRIEEAAEVINNAKRPFIYFGGGVVSSDSADEVMALAEKIDAPMGCSMMGLSCVPSDNPHFLGMQGMHGHYASTMSMNKADVIIALGVRFNDRSTNDRLKFAPNAKVVHIDVDGSELSKTVDDFVSLRGDLKLTLKSILPMLEKRTNEAWMKTVEKLKSEEKKLILSMYPGYSNKTREKEKKPLLPVDLYNILNKYIDNALVVTDVGQHQLWAAQMLKFSFRRQFISNGGLGAMGYGMGGAIGAYMATGKKTILITGDGSFGMNLNELATAVSYKIPLVIILINNKTLGLVRQYQTMFYKKHYSATDIDRKTDFVALAKAFGAEGVRVDTLGDFEITLESVFGDSKKVHKAGVPIVIECMIDKDEPVLPMLKPNGSTEDILTSM